jgi:hypothetical protein
MAVLCQRVEPRPDGTVDVLGIVDGVVIEPEGTDPLGLHPDARVALTALVSLRAGEVRGAHRLALVGLYPSGREGPAFQRQVEFTDAAPAASLIVPVDLEIHEPGVYAFDVRFDDRRLTRMQLWVGYQGS